MKFLDYEMFIVGGVESPGGYVGLYHGKQYQITLRNRGGMPCACKLIIDGKNIGRFQIGWGSEITLERPSDDVGCFTFIEYGSVEAAQVGLALDTNLGLITASFYPEIPDAEFPCGNPLYSQAGGTALTGESDQTFHMVEALRTEEFPAATIHLRLTSGEPPRIRPLSQGGHQKISPFPPLIVPKGAPAPDPKRAQRRL